MEGVLLLYRASVRSCLEYACAAWHTSLAQVQNGMTESIQKRALSCSYFLASYREVLVLSAWETRHARRETLAKNACCLHSNRLHHLLPNVRFTTQLGVRGSSIPTSYCPYQHRVPGL